MVFCYLTGFAQTHDADIYVEENSVLSDVELTLDNQNDTNSSELVLSYSDNIVGNINADVAVLDDKTNNENNDDAYIEASNENEIDFGSFNASYNLFAATAQLEMGNAVDDYLVWRGEQSGELSATFLAWCSKKIGFDDIVPIVYTASELKDFYKELGTYYRKNGCYPQTGDLVLFDLDDDSVPDHVEILTLRYGSYFNTVGIKAPDVESEPIVCDSQYEMYDSDIYGFCRPNYNMEKLDWRDTSIFGFNAVDTVVAAKKQEYADILAENGIEVIARYINPEGRTPLSVEEAQMYFNAGIRVMMIYEVMADDPYKGYDKGVEIGTKALEHARNLCAPKGTPIFYCCDCNSKLEKFSQVSAFLCGVKDAMQGEYGVGLYGGFHVVEAMDNMGLLDAYWQCWSLSLGYLSDNYDIIQYSNGQKYFDDIPYVFDANYVKNPEKVSYILSTETTN